MTNASVSQKRILPKSNSPALVRAFVKLTMHLILRKLEGGDHRRSIGRSEEVVSDILENPDYSGI
jgi:hypothetical protein